MEQWLQLFNQPATQMHPEPIMKFSTGSRMKW